jgi:hypothetical protein
MPNRAYYALGMPLGLYLAIVLAGRREDARALAGFVPTASSSSRGSCATSGYRAGTSYSSPR